MKRKILFKIISVVTLLACGMGFAACEFGNADNSAAWGSVYTIETAYAEAQELGYSGSLEQFIKSISGEDGKDGIGIFSTGINAYGELIVTLTDRTEINLGKVVGNNGKDGEDGLSAFEIYLKYHPEYSGTEKEWIESLKAQPCEHTFSPWEIGLEPTCTSMGYDIRVCTQCGNVEYKFIQSTGHIFNSDEYERTDKYHMQCCDVCGTNITERHSYGENGFCKCGDSDIFYGVGDCVNDFIYESLSLNNDGSVTYFQKKLYDAFANGKKMILITYFYTTCGPMVSTFPALREAYEEYSDVVEIISISDYALDTKFGVSAYKNSIGIPWDIVFDGEEQFSKPFNVSVYPTFFIIDRNGILQQIEYGGITDPDVFMEWFDTYTSDEYAS